ncbi:MAG: hypothetical protein ACPIOQ_78665, partial [Promethearchaeia archaeon]
AIAVEHVVHDPTWNHCRARWHLCCVNSGLFLLLARVCAGRASWLGLSVQGDAATSTATSCLHVRWRSWVVDVLDRTHEF